MYKQRDGLSRQINKWTMIKTDVSKLLDKQTKVTKLMVDIYKHSEEFSRQTHRWKKM